MKTGGMSMTRMFHAHFGRARRYPTADDPAARRHQKMTPATLLEMTPAERARFSFVSVHMSAWIAEVMFPDLFSVTVLRDPVERTISHLRQIADLPQTADDLEAIYEDPNWHARLLDHQVQVFAAEPQERPMPREEREVYNPARYEEPERSRIRQLLLAAFTTTISEARVIDEASYAEAAARLDRVDEVGVTEQLDVVMTRVAARLGWERSEIRRDNVSERRADVPTGLRDRIERENRWDRMLYDRALARQAG
jgi:hypothetical protein